jgi:hypothetical protein
MLRRGRRHVEVRVLGDFCFNKLHRNQLDKLDLKTIVIARAVFSFALTASLGTISIMFSCAQHDMHILDHQIWDDVRPKGWASAIVTTKLFCLWYLPI